MNLTEAIAKHNSLLQEKGKIDQTLQTFPRFGRAFERYECFHNSPLYKCLNKYNKRIIPFLPWRKNKNIIKEFFKNNDLIDYFLVESFEQHKQYNLTDYILSILEHPKIDKEAVKDIFDNTFRYVNRRTLELFMETKGLRHKNFNIYHELFNNNLTQEILISAPRQSNISFIKSYNEHLEEYFSKKDLFDDDIEEKKLWSNIYDGFLNLPWMKELRNGNQKAALDLLHEEKDFSVYDMKSNRFRPNDSNFLILQMACSSLYNCSDSFLQTLCWKIKEGSFTVDKRIEEIKDKKEYESEYEYEKYLYTIKLFKDFELNDKLMKDLPLSIMEENNKTIRKTKKI